MTTWLPVRPRVRFRGVHLWWIGLLLFTPSVALWFLTTLLLVLNGTFSCPFDRLGIARIYLPIAAAFLGLALPLLGRRFLQRSSNRVNCCAFAAYISFMLAWGMIDVRHENYQLGGHKYTNESLLHDHTSYFHNYYTWYFLPYKWIEHTRNG